MTTIWNETTNAIVLAGWGKKDPGVIAGEVRAALPVPGLTTGAQGAGVIWQAFKLGLITEKQREAELRRNKRAHSAPLPKAVREAVLEEEPQCRCCGVWEGLQVSRVVPPLAGGGDERANLWTLCQGCAARAKTRTWPSCVREVTTALPIAAWVNHARRLKGNALSMGRCSHGKDLCVTRGKHPHHWRIAHAVPIPGSKQVRFEDAVVVLVEYEARCRECADAMFPIAPYLPEPDEPAFFGDEVEGLLEGGPLRGHLVGVRSGRYLIGQPGSATAPLAVDKPQLIRPAPRPPV